MRSYVDSSDAIPFDRGARPCDALLIASSSIPKLWMEGEVSTKDTFALGVTAGSEQLVWNDRCSAVDLALLAAKRGKFVQSTADRGNEGRMRLRKK